MFVTTDASKQGLGAVLAQKDEKGHSRPVAFSSRSLTDYERDTAPMNSNFLQPYGAYKFIDTY